MGLRDKKGKFITGHQVPEKWKKAIAKNCKDNYQGENHPNWKGGSKAYLRKKARIIMNAKPNEIVHHKDGNLKNFNKNNLIIMNQSYHAKMHYNNGDYPKFILNQTNRGGSRLEFY